MNWEAAYSILGLGLALMVYFVPTIYAALEEKYQVNAIFVLNLFLGWTFLGWVGAFVWAVAAEKRQQKERA